MKKLEKFIDELVFFICGSVIGYSVWVFVNLFSIMITYKLWVLIPRLFSILLIGTIVLSLYLEWKHYRKSSR